MTEAMQLDISGIPFEEPDREEFRDIEQDNPDISLLKVRILTRVTRVIINTFSRMARQTQREKLKIN